MGYQVYMTSPDGQESDIGFTDGTVYTYTPPVNGSYNFTVRTAYSVYKANQSSGITVNVNVSGGQDYTPSSEQPEESEEEENTVPTISINKGVLVGDTYNICLNGSNSGGSAEIHDIINASSNVGNANIRYLIQGNPIPRAGNYIVSFSGDKPTGVTVYAEKNGLESAKKKVNVYTCNACNSNNTCE